MTAQDAVRLEARQLRPSLIALPRAAAATNTVRPGVPVALQLPVEACCKMLQDFTRLTAGKVTACFVEHLVILCTRAISFAQRPHCTLIALFVWLARHLKWPGY